jgi:hypothetical protein
VAATAAVSRRAAISCKAPRLSPPPRASSIIGSPRLSTVPAARHAPESISVRVEEGMRGANKARGGSGERKEVASRARRSFSVTAVGWLTQRGRLGSGAAAMKGTQRYVHVLFA